MAVPRNRLSNSRKNTRRSHHARTPCQLVRCTKCQAARMPHTICRSCGTYGGREVVAAQAAE